jgi:hypothetical protein
MRIRVIVPPLKEKLFNEPTTISLLESGVILLSRCPVLLGYSGYQSGNFRESCLLSTFDNHQEQLEWLKDRLLRE